MRIPYVTIVCAGHSGSTVLARALDAHPEVAVFGEFLSISKYLRAMAAGTQKGLCSFHDGDFQVLAGRKPVRRATS